MIIRSFLIKERMTEKELAGKAGVAEATIYRIQSEQKGAGDPARARVAAVVGCEPEDLKLKRPAGRWRRRRRAAKS
jgi:DNA-binding Xre family transcriptional regulator